MSVDRVIRQEKDEEHSKSDTKDPNSSVVSIKATELEMLTNEWIRSGRGDLFIDNTLCEKIYRYAEFRKQFAEAMAYMLKTELERYIIPGDFTKVSCSKLKFFSDKENDELLLETRVFAGPKDNEWTPKVIRGNDFKQLLSSLGNKMISYAFPYTDDNADESYIDLSLYCSDMGIKLEYITNPYGTDRIKVILPKGWEEKNAKGIIGIV